MTLIDNPICTIKPFQATFFMLNRFDPDSHQTLFYTPLNGHNGKLTAEILLRFFELYLSPENKLGAVDTWLKANPYSFNVCDRKDGRFHFFHGFTFTINLLTKNLHCWDNYGNTLFAGGVEDYINQYIKGSAVCIPKTILIDGGRSEDAAFYTRTNGLYVLKHS